jgi:hypothetical protein
LFVSSLAVTCGDTLTYTLSTSATSLITPQSFKTDISTNTAILEDGLFESASYQFFVLAIDSDGTIFHASQQFTLVVEKIDLIPFSAAQDFDFCQSTVSTGSITKEQYFETQVTNADVSCSFVGSPDSSVFSFRTNNQGIIV